MNVAQYISVNPDCLQRFGGSADHIARLYCEVPAFRALWDDYAVCQIGLQNWVGSPDPEADQRCLEYTRTLRELEWEIRQQIERSWDLVQEAVAPVVFGSATEILCELRERHALRGREVYLSPLFPLIEMAWLGQHPGREVSEFVRACGQYICKRLGQLAGGLEVLGEKHLNDFLSRFMSGAESPRQLKRLSELGLAYLRTHSNPELVRARERAVWRCCYRIANANLSHAPNPQQWDRLLDLVPESIGHRDFQILSRTDIPGLMADLEHAWARA